MAQSPDAKGDTRRLRRARASFLFMLSVWCLGAGVLSVGVGFGNTGPRQAAYHYAGVADIAVALVTFALSAALYRKRSWLLALLPVALCIASQIYCILVVDTPIAQKLIGLGVRLFFGFLVVASMSEGASERST